MKHLLILFTSIISIHLSAQMAITMPAEYEKDEGVIMAWPYTSAIDSTVAEISGYAAASGDVWLLYNPDSISTDTNDIRAFLQSTGNNHNNIYFIPAYNNTFYIREYGPVMGYGVFDQLLVRYLGDPVFDAYNRPEDDSVPSQLANFWQTDYVQYNLTFEPGNVLVDGETNIFTSDYILQENLPMTEAEVKQQLSEIFNISNVTILESPENSGGGTMKSLDMFMKLLDSETMLISELPDSMPDYNIIENNVNIIQGMNNVYEAPYKIVRVKAAPLDNGQYDTTLLGELRSYTNALILNNLILVPSYNNPEYDSAAFHAFKDNTYGMTIKMIDATKLAPLHAAIHTITREKPQEHFLRINHKKVEGANDYEGDEYTITCLATGDDIIDNMWLYYRFNADTTWQQSPVHLVCPTHYGIIENAHLTDTIHYYLEVNTVSGNSLTYPISAPEGNFTFWFDVTGITQQRGTPTPVVYPNPVTDEFLLGNIEKSTLIEYKILDLNGRTLDEGSVFAGKPARIKTPLVPGIYILSIESAKGVQNIKFIKR